MKIFVLTCFMLASALAASIPQGQARNKRASDELSTIYLPPQAGNELEDAVSTEVDIATTTLAPEESSAVLGEKGYEYRTVRRLKYRYRTVRDVSHLSQAYLPPPPSNEYLPPLTAEEEAAPKLANEYLPPAEEVVEVTTEVAVPAEPEVRVNGLESEVVESADAPAPEEETAILADDGYHYKQPEESAMLKIGNPEAEYLPPLEKGVVEAVGPEESAVLADDGYHYRAVKRFRF